MTGRQGRSGHRAGEKNRKRRSDGGTVRGGPKSPPASTAASEPPLEPTIPLPLPNGWDPRLQEIWDQALASIPAIVRTEQYRSKIEFLCRCELAVRAAGINPRPSLLSQVRLAREALERDAAKLEKPRPTPKHPRQAGWPEWWSPDPNQASRPDERLDREGAANWDDVIGVNGYLDLPENIARLKAEGYACSGAHSRCVHCEHLPQCPNRSLAR